MILLRGTATTDDIAGLAVCAGLVTTSGARTSHAAVVARQLGVVTVVGCRDMSIDIRRERVRFGEHEVAEGELITVDGDRWPGVRGPARDDNRTPSCADRTGPRMASIRKRPTEPPPSPHPGRDRRPKTGRISGPKVMFAEQVQRLESVRYRVPSSIPDSWVNTVPECTRRVGRVR